LSGRGLCDELITRPEESYRLCCVVVCDLETSRMGAPYIYDIGHLRVNDVPYELSKRKVGRFAHVSCTTSYVTSNLAFCFLFISYCAAAYVFFEYGALQKEII